MKRMIFFIGLVLGLFCNATQAQNVTYYKNSTPYELYNYFTELLPQKDTLYAVLVFPKKTQENSAVQIAEFLQEIKTLSPECETVVISSSFWGRKLAGKYLDTNQFPCDYTVVDAGCTYTGLMEFSPKKLKDHFYVMKIDRKKGVLLKSEYVEENVKEMAANLSVVSKPDGSYKNKNRIEHLDTEVNTLIGAAVLDAILLTLILTH